MFNKLTAAIFTLFFVAFVVGYSTMQSSWDGTRAINVSQLRSESFSRDPAAIRKVYDFSTLSGGALASASKRRLLLGSDVIQEESRVGVQFGHFVVEGPEGRRVFACSRYSKMQMTFEAEGFAINGDRPRMIVTGACRVSADINQIDPIWLPVSDIVKEEPGEVELEFMEGDTVTVRFEDLVDQWPSSWELREVRMINEGAKMIDEVTVNSEDIRRFTGEPISMQWFF